MFDIGFTELLLVGIVALVVLGPDRLPGAVRTAGLWIGRIKRSFSAIKAEVEREIGAALSRLEAGLAGAQVVIDFDGGAA